MAKFFETNEEYVDLVVNKFNETGLNSMGFVIKVMSVNKAKNIVKVSKANATAEFLMKKDGLITLIIYEAAFDRLPTDAQEQLIEMGLSNIYYDSDKDKLSIETNPHIEVMNMRKKYGDGFLDTLEVAYLTMQQIEDEERERKLAEKENKKNRN